MSLKLVDFDPVDYLKTEKAVTEFLKAAKEGNDANHIEQAQLIAEKARRRNEHKKRRSIFTKFNSCSYTFFQEIPSWSRPAPFQALSSDPVAIQQ